MKAILISIKPRHVVNILNGKKTIEIRKKFPKDYVGWVYIYVTKDSRYFLDQWDEPNDNSWFCWDYTEGTFLGEKKNGKFGKLAPDEVSSFNGKVVARFWCDKVEEIEAKLTALGYAPYTKTLSMPDLLKNSCLTIKDLDNYLQGNKGHAIHITKVDPFDEPKEISEFYKVGYENSVIATKKYILNAMNREERRRYKTEIDLKINNEIAAIKDNYKLTRVPQSWCYVEL